MKYISENYLNVMDDQIALKRELEKRSGVPERAAKFMVGDIRNEDKEDLFKFHRRYAPPNP